MAFSHMVRVVVCMVFDGMIMKVAVSLAYIDVLADVPVQIHGLILLPEDWASSEAGPGVAERANTLDYTDGGKQVPQQVLHECLVVGGGEARGQVDGA